MRYRYLFTLLCLFFNSISFAQQSKDFTVNSGQDIGQAIPADELYAYPTFREGMVFFKNNTASSGILNYHYFMKEFFFVGGNGDTTALANPEEADSIVIGNDKFYFAGGFIKKDTLVGETTLATTWDFIPSEKQVVGAYGIASNSVAHSDYYQYFSRIGNGASIVAAERVTLSKHMVYYIGNKTGQFLPITKKNLFVFYAKKEQGLGQYLKENKTNFSNRADLLKLIVYMESL
jgi:hypothetical protein